MPPKRNSMSAAAIERLISQRVADALLDYEVNQNNGNGNGNRNGNGIGNNNGNGSHDSGSGSGRTLHTAHGCTNCVVGCQVKYATYTLLGGALTWWNSYVRTVGHDAAHEMTWKSLMKMMTEAYSPRNEIQKLENELWNLNVKVTDLVRYTQCCQELALLCLRMVPDEEDKVERFIWGLPDSIQGIQTNKKRRMENNPRDDYVQQLPYKRHNVARAYTVGLELKNQNHENQARISEAHGRVYALGGGEADQDPSNIADDINA
ncbi:reverse transcriptase domain-containing protein [Tanacetum coccineum]